MNENPVIKAHRHSSIELLETKFDRAAFDAAISGQNGWREIADPVAEIRRMRSSNG